ncbi:exported protein of unknown function [Candidatus Hydrogenisulfobacillus filiaventi]|uniref:Uncharacterized protein n=1 Tax=Candidatus Hydrogenisulfobacillus filiaventi TaxID=2707344 RepID=A0A6F8ZDV4_9FIRM|nr:hypothetical protein [Bacillota bacterium]CAB1127789.1 exported protein of unknown function [Candidatus Hydrogenisulfobacillus filiaventi]
MQNLTALWALLAAMMAAGPSSQAMQPHGQVTVSVSTPAGTRTVTAPLSQVAPGLYGAAASLQQTAGTAQVSAGATASAAAISPATWDALWSLLASRL